MMQRSIKKTVIVITVLITVLLIFSSSAFSKPFVRIRLDGLKEVHIRADIIKGVNPEGGGPKHGRVQFRIKEAESLILGEESHYYTYKFSVDLRRATENHEYEIYLWADLPNIKFTIYGDGSEEWGYFEDFVNDLGLDDDHNPENNKIEISLLRLGLVGHNEEPTGIKIMTDDRGSYKFLKTGGIAEMDAVEWAIDFGLPLLKPYLLKLFEGDPEKIGMINWFFNQEWDFEDFHIVRIKMWGGYYTISMGIKFIGGGSDNFCTEMVTFALAMGHFVWVPPPTP